MKKILLVSLAIIINFAANAQNYEEDEYYEEELPRVYLGLGVGLNSYTGILGLSANFRITELLYIQGGLGISAWGGRGSIGLRYDLKKDKGFIFGVMYTSSSGIADVDLDFTDASGNTDSHNMTLFSAQTLNLKSGYKWSIGQKYAFRIDFGYALALKDRPWQTNDGSRLSASSQQLMGILEPGGIIFGIGFDLGL